MPGESRGMLRQLENWGAISIGVDFDGAGSGRNADSVGLGGVGDCEWRDACTGRTSCAGNAAGGKLVPREGRVGGG